MCFCLSNCQISECSETRARPVVGVITLFRLLCSPQRKAKYSENKLKTLKARNEYLLTLEATNASVFKYYIHDLPDIIDVSSSPLHLH